MARMLAWQRTVAVFSFEFRLDRDVLELTIPQQTECLDEGDIIDVTLIDEAIQPADLVAAVDLAAVDRGGLRRAAAAVQGPADRRAVHQQGPGGRTG